VRAPFCLGDRDQLEKLLAECGAEAVTITTQQGLARFPTIRSMVEAELRSWLPVRGITLPEDRIEQILEEAEEALSTFRTGNGTVLFDSPAHIVAAVKPKKPN
jgi:hypothetical protein